MQQFRQFVFTPPGCDDPSLAIAGSRAGGIGVFNAEYHRSAESIESALAHLATHAHGEFGVRVGSFATKPFFTQLTQYLPRGLAWVIVDPAMAKKQAKWIDGYRADGGQIVVEIMDWDDKLPKSLPALDGWMVKGHEAGGRVGEETTFILLQKALDELDVPVYAHGGIGMHTSAACYAAGAAGVVLDNQLLLLQESPLADTLRVFIGKLVGNETITLGDPGDGEYYRILERPGLLKAKSIREKSHTQSLKDIATAVIDHTNWEFPQDGVLPMGQDVAFAAPWAERFVTVGGVLGAMRDSLSVHLQQAHEFNPLAAGSPLAVSHGTTYPIVQGPMTRVSDTAGFAAGVAEGGGLPMLGLALMRPEGVRKLLEETKEKIKGKPWGVGLLGFAPAELFNAQLAVAREFKPEFALIAGGRPDQALDLEREGVPSYLHVPSPRLLSMFIEQGARRFVFEGRECGGHIGPLASFVLWESMVDTLLAEVTDPKIAQDLHLLFAGGIHDARSAAMVATMTAPLAAMGMQIGVLMGTAYLFTKEIVAGGGIVANFQKQAIKCTRTVGLETGVGHSSRCSDTGFAQEFLATKRKMLADGCSPDEIRDALEDLNLGRLRLASKGTERGGPEGKIQKVGVKRQTDDGMFMIGQVATIQTKMTTVKELHQAVTEGSSDAIAKQLDALLASTAERDEANPSDIAIVGVGCVLPRAKNGREFWENIVNKIDAITEIPAHRWDWRLYFDEDRTVKDKIYSKWGGFMDDMVFNPLDYGIPPKTLKALDPLQLMTLEVVGQALKDAGYAEREFDRSKVSVILGASGGAGDVGAQYAVRAELPRFYGELDEEAASRLPEWTEDSFAGILLNVAAGRAANRFDFGGLNYTTDAACASSLAAIYQGVVELEDKRSDMVIVGGIDTVQGPFGYLCFAQTQALSPRGKCSTFDANGDGICISEGLATVCLKRLEDAERDGDRIYAVIKGVGGSSDGRAKSMTAPHPDGQIRALERAYTKAGYSPATVGLFEAHGTGTVAGDNAELETVTRLMANAGAQPKTSVIGSVKTMIGHTKASAGVAGLIKSALSLHHRVLPPHCNVETPVDKVGSNDSPLYLLKDPQPWIADADKPRRASVSAFGFGGTNFHIAMQEYDGEYLPQVRPAVRETWPAELLVWAANDNDALVTNIQETAALFAQQANPCMRDIAYTLATTSNGTLRAAMVATDGANAQQLIGHLVAHIQDSGKPLPPGAYFNRAPLAEEGGVALLFAGQGSQYPNMLRDVALEFDDIANVLERAESLVGDDIESASGMRLSRMIYTPGLYSDADEKAAAAALTRTEVTQPALAVIEAGLWGLLQRCGVKPDMAAGHSYGEFAALYAAGVISLDELIKVSAARGRFVAAAGVGDADLGGMVAVRSERERVEQVAKAFDDLTVANHNSSSQTILSGSKASVRAVAEKFSAVDIDATVLPVGAAFHSSFVAAARDQLADYIASMEMQPPAFPVYSNTTAKPHANKVAGIRKTLSAHMVSPVEFVAEIEAMYAAGARVFVGLGPKNVQASLVDQILGEREHKVVRIDDHEGGLKGLLNGLGMMFAEGMALNFDPIYERRNCQTIKLADPASATREVPPPKHAWILNGGSARALNEELRAPMTLEEAQALKAKRAVPVASSIPVQPPPVAAAESPAPAPVQRQPKRRLKPTRRIRKETAMTDNYPPSVGVSGDGQSYAPEGEREALLVAYQETMQQFLESQERIMLAYLTGSAPAQSGARPAALAVPRARQAVPRPPMVPPPVAAAPVAAPAAPAPAPAAPPPPVVATPPPAPAPAPVAAPAAAATVDAASITSMLLEIVEDRTGYPQDMLGLDQNMEADLGIDSIKRVEIVGAMIKALPSGYVNGEASEGLNAKKTLQEMIDYLAAAGTGKEAATAPFNHTEVEAVDSNCAPLPRFIIQAQTESADAIPLDPFDKGLYIIVDEGYGVGAAIQASVTSAGATVVMIDAKPAANAAQLQRLLDAARAEHGPVRGVFHLAALAAERYDSDAQLSAWQTSVTLNDKSLYQLIQMLADDLQSGGRVVAATAQGGSFAREGAQPGLVACGGSTGLLKSVHEEWPALQVKAVDLDPALSGLANAEILCNEWRLPGGRIEVGYPAGQRTVFRSVEAPMSATNVSPEHTPDSDWVVLATGGARGITAEVLVGLASAGVQLVLVGRTEEPGAEDPAMVGLTSEAELQGYLLQRAKAEGRSLKPIEVKQQIAAILRDREIAGNLADFRAAGARVDYRVADVRNEEGIKALLDDIYKQYGRLDGLVHGAGIIEDKALINKTMESASRVIDTKVDSTFVLSKYLRSHNLKFVVFFTSVAGRYGNTGQVDYATANEIVNRLALQLYWQWDEKVTVSAINWGPWAPTRYGKGMVSPETERKFAAMGVALVYPEPGRDLFMHSVTRAPSANVEVIAGLGPWEQRECERGEFRAGAMPRSATGASVSSVYPLLANTEQSAGPRGEIILHRTISVANDDYLSEHLLDDVPVLPAAGALELIAEAASSAWPGWVVSEISELRVLSGIQLKQNEVDIEIVALASSHGDASGFDASMTLRPAGGKGAAYYKATAHLASEIPESTPYQSTLQPGPASVDVAHAYREWLFHGPRFQTMRGFDGLDKRGALADIQPTSAASWLPNVQAEHDWLFDPGVIDSGPQMAIVWAHVMRDASALPSRFGRVRRFGTGPLGKCKMHFLLYPDQDDSTVKADVAFVDQQGHLRLFMEEMECSSSPALVRLGGGWKGEISV